MHGSSFCPVRPVDCVCVIHQALVCFRRGVSALRSPRWHRRCVLLVSEGAGLFVCVRVGGSWGIRGLRSSMRAILRSAVTDLRSLRFTLLFMFAGSSAGSVWTVGRGSAAGDQSALPGQLRQVNTAFSLITCIHPFRGCSGAFRKQLYDSVLV